MVAIVLASLFGALRHCVLCIQIPDGDGALALHVMPRYILHNNLQQGVQYKQQVCPLTPANLVLRF